MFKKMQISKEFDFAASHFLTDYHGKCENLHGHNFWLKVTVEGEVKKDGMVIDFKELKRIVKEMVIDKLDHTNLNDLFDNPSSEIIIQWIWEQLVEVMPEGVALFEIKLKETNTSEVTLRG